MNKEEIYEFIKEKQIWFEITEHKPIYSMDDLVGEDIPYPEADAKNLFIRDDKKRNFYLITVKGDKKIDLKDFKIRHNLRRLTFASAEDLMLLLKLEPGFVSPFGLLNDKSNQVIWYVDEELVNQNLMAAHPNDNTVTMWLKTKDLIKIVEDSGHSVVVTKLY